MRFTLIYTGVFVYLRPLLFLFLCRAGFWDPVRPAEGRCRALRPQTEPLPACIRICEINQSLHLAVHSCRPLLHISRQTLRVTTNM